MKKENKLILITFLCSLFPLVTGLILWKQLPTSLPIHFDLKGFADQYASKQWFVLGLPVLMALFDFILIKGITNDPKKINIGNKMFLIAAWAVPVISNVTINAIYGLSLGYAINISTIVCVLIGLLFIIVGNYMPKNHQNYTVGIRLPWTLDNAENWKLTHRFASRIWIIMGFIIMICTFLNLQFALIFLIILAAILPIIYSYLLYKKGLN